MDLNQRFNILAQGATIAQKKGILSLDDAVNCKNLIDKISKGEELRESLVGLVNICVSAQAAGVYTLADAHLIYLSADGLDEEINNFISQNAQNAGQQENVENEQAPESAAPEAANVDYEIAEDAPVVDVPQQEVPQQEVPAEEPEQKKPAAKKSTRKKK